MRTAALLPKIANRSPREQWEIENKPNLQTQAMRRVHEILSRDNPVVFSPNLDARIWAEFKGLVAGDAVAIDFG